MPMMAKMRSLAPAFIVGVGLIFVLFMILSDSNVMEVFGLRTNNVGSVNGTKITYQEFAKAMDNERENYKQQTGKDVPDENSPQFRDQVWDAMVTQTLLAEVVKKYGISVSDDEIRSIILGPNPPDFLKRNFIDSTGKFNRELYLNALYNPQNAQPLIQAEQVIRQSQLNQKLQSMLLASITVSNAEVRRAFIDQTTKLDAQFALVGLNQFPDSEFKISENDLKDYYNNHLDKYQIKAQRKLKFVLFRNVPSAADSDNVRMDLEADLDQLKNNDTTTFKSLIDTYSSVPYSKDTLEISAFPEAAAAKLWDAKSGAIIGPYASGEGYVVYHYLGSVPSKETFVKASHILINQYGSDEKNLAEAMSIYYQLKKGADFATLAKEYSKDPGSAVKGGNLGWFGKGQMVPEFEKAAFSGAIGEVQKPIKTNYGYHIIKVTGRTNNKFIVERLVNPITASSATRDQQMSNAKDFAYIAKKDGFDKEAKLMNYVVQETPSFTKDAYYVPGIGVSKNIIKFAFDNSLNTISEPFTVANGAVVVEISGITSAGVKSFDQVKDQIKPLVLREKKYEKAEQAAQNIMQKIGNDLTKAPSVDPKATVDTTGTFGLNQSIPNVGIDYAFSAEAMKAPLNKVDGPVKGEKGYYLIKVLYRTPFDSTAFSVQRTTILDNLLRQKKNSFFSQWLANLKKDASIDNNLSQFYGQ